MTHASLTPERTTDERIRDLLPEDDIPDAEAGADGVRSTDELRRAEAQRLERMERERATDEGMVPIPVEPDDI
jgi:hypothetical protein